MSTADEVIYWAEDALGEEYTFTDHSFIKRGQRQSLLASGVAFVSTVSIGLALASAFTPATPTIVHVLSVETASDVVHRAGPSPNDPAHPDSAALAPGPVDPRTSVQQPGASLSKPSRPAPHEQPAVHQESGPAHEKMIVVPRKALPPAPPANMPPTPPRKENQAAGLAPEPARTDSSRSSPAAEPRATGLSPAAATKPQDIAPAEKFGIKGIYVEGIELLNGRRIRNGSPLPNGELLMGTDPARGMVETDRRVMSLVR